MIMISATAQASAQGDKDTAWNTMELAFVSLDVAVEGRNSAELREHIELLLREKGDPVRWAIVSTDRNRSVCHVDAVVSFSAT